MPSTASISFRTSLAIFSNSLRSGPIILAALPPLTPETATSILSFIYCEKLKVTPGSSSAVSFSSFCVSCSFVKPDCHSSKGFRGAKICMFEKAWASLPLSGRPNWEMTVLISGCLSKLKKVVRQVSYSKQRQSLYYSGSILKEEAEVALRYFWSLDGCCTRLTISRSSF